LPKAPDGGAGVTLRALKVVASWCDLRSPDAD
jgi:hypothetical protein